MTRLLKKICSAIALFFLGSLAILWGFLFAVSFLMGYIFGSVSTSFMAGMRTFDQMGKAPVASVLIQLYERLHDSIRSK